MSETQSSSNQTEKSPEEKLNIMADQASKESSVGGFMQPGRNRRGRPKGSHNKGHEKVSLPSHGPGAESSGPGGVQNGPQGDVIAVYKPLATGVVETLSNVCVQLAEDERAKIDGQARVAMIDSGAVCGYYFLGAGSEKWVALGTFLLIGGQAVWAATRLRAENLAKMRAEARQHNSQNNGAASPRPVTPFPV
jgi:hypothetical protein